MGWGRDERFQFVTMVRPATNSGIERSAQHHFLLARAGRGNPVLTRSVRQRLKRRVGSSQGGSNQGFDVPAEEVVEITQRL